jgi:hypothetical protein
MHYPISMISIPVSNTYTAHVRLNRVEIFYLLSTCSSDEIYPETGLMSVLGAGHVTPKSKADWFERNHGIDLVARQPNRTTPLAENSNMPKLC